MIGERKRRGRTGTGDSCEKRKKWLVPHVHAYAFFNSASTRFGVNGPSRRRTPTASKIALAMDAAGGIVAPSPAPSGVISGRLISTTSRSGRSGNLKIG